MAREYGSFLESLVPDLSWTKLLLGEPTLVDPQLYRFEDLDRGVLQIAVSHVFELWIEDTNERSLLQLLADFVSVDVIETQSEKTALIVDGQIWTA